MQIADIFSFSLFLIFAIAFILKLLLLKIRNKIDANVLVKGNKELSIQRAEVFVRISSLLWQVTWITEIIFHKQLSHIFKYFIINAYTSYIGILVIAVGISIFILAIIFMKSSWRVGIDKNTRTFLITNGIYKLSRNPAFVGFNLMSFGLFITYSNLLTLLILIINIISFHLLILQEEKHLFSMFGEDYLNYKQQVPRYFLMPVPLILPLL
jgi:protein-S-isoprenylcysteine O-methyltransferase Ste14